MIGPRAADSVLFVGASRPAFAAEVGAVTRLNGRTVVIGDKALEPAADRAAGNSQNSQNGAKIAKTAWNEHWHRGRGVRRFAGGKRLVHTIARRYATQRQSELTLFRVLKHPATCKWSLRDRVPCRITPRLGRGVPP